MYLVILALVGMLAFIWAVPHDPGGQMAAGGRAQSFATPVLIYHQTAIAYAIANPGFAGTVPPLTLPGHWSNNGAHSCISGFLVQTWVTVPPSISSPAVATALKSQWGNYPDIGVAANNTIPSPVTGTLALPCAIPNGTPVILSAVH